MCVIDDGVILDGHFTVTGKAASVPWAAETAANACAIIAAGYVIDFSIAGDFYFSDRSIGTAADTGSTFTALNFFHSCIAGNGHMGVADVTTASASTKSTASRFNCTAAYRNVSVASVGIWRNLSITSTNACRTIAAGGSNIAAGNGNLTGICVAAANTSSGLSTRGSQTASVIFVVLNGQLAAGNITLTVRSLVVLQTSAITAALQFVVAIQLDIGIALAGHVYSCVGSIVKGGGTGIDSAAGVDVHILKLDLYLIILIFGLDGHSVGRRGVLVTICDGGVGVFLVGGRALCDLVRPFGLTRRNRNVTIFDVPCPCKGRGGKGGEHCGGQDKRRCPLRGRTG